MPPHSNRNWDLVAWTPFQQCTIPADALNRMDPPDFIVVNSRYQVTMYLRGDVGGDFGRCIHLSIKTLDKSARHDWRDFQRIKNELVGTNSEAVELYPSESRLVDTANQYHLFCFAPGVRLPFGFNERLVADGDWQNSKQRPWPDGERPADCLDADAFDARLRDFLQKANGHHATE